MANSSSAGCTGRGHADQAIKRVLYVVGTYPKVSQTFVANEIEAVRAAGIDVQVVAIRSEEVTSESAPNPVIKLGTLPGMPTPRDVLRAKAVTDDSFSVRCWTPLAARAVVRRISGWHPDIVHTQFIDKPAPLGLAVAKLLGVPATITAHAVDYRKHVSSAVLAARVEQADRVFVISEAAGRDIGRLTNRPPSTFPVIRACPSTAQSWTRVDGGADIVTVARLVPKKGVDIAIRAFAELAKGGGALRYQIIGDGPERQALGDLARSLGVADRVELSGSRPPAVAASAIAAARVIVLPCRLAEDGDADGIPVVLMEAGMARVPVVSTPIGGIPELIEDGVSGVLVEPDNVYAVRDGLARVLGDGALSVTLAAGLHQRVTTEFDGSLQVRRMVSHWSSLQETRLA